MDFIGFTYNGYHSIRDLGIYRVSDGSRYTEDLAPTMEDKTAEVPGADGMYYFGTRFKERTFNVQYAFDSLTESGLARLKEAFRGDGIHDLIFDETPYKVWGAKVTGSAQIKHLCFEENGERVYKGEGSITFTCYYPYAHTPEIAGEEKVKKAGELPTEEWIPVGAIVGANGYLTFKATNFCVRYCLQEGARWGSMKEKVAVTGDKLSEDTRAYIVEIKADSFSENRIIISSGSGVASACKMIYTDSGCFEHENEKCDGKDINSYSIADYPNKKEWAIASNLATFPYFDFNHSIGAINRGQLPAPFQLTASSVSFNSTNPKLQVGDCAVVLSVEKDAIYKDFVWDSKTGIIKAKDGDNIIYISYSGDSIGTIPVNTTGIKISYPEAMTLNYHYWYL